MKRTKGVFFSIDALIALLVIFLALVVIYPLVLDNPPETEIQYDILSTLSLLRVSEFNSTLVQSLIASGEINDTNKTLLEQIGEFYVTNVTRAQELSEEVFSEISTPIDFGVWYGSSLVYSRNKSGFDQAQQISTARQLVSGLSQGLSVTGFSARAFLTNSFRNEFVYFGGYVGDGNISIRASYSGNISSVRLETTVSNDFDLYVNDNFSGNFSKSSTDFVPSTYNISTQHFHSGDNIVEFRGENLHIAGGFLRITYQSSAQFSQPTRYYFPGISGLINLYDGFYIPGDLEHLTIVLHINNSLASSFMNIGNVTVFSGTSNDEETIILNNSVLSSLLDYSELSSETIPLRLGLENASFLVNGTGKADVFSVTDLSGSMNECAEFSAPLMCNYNCLVGGSKRCGVGDSADCTGNVCGGFCFIPFGHNLDCDSTKMDLAKQANDLFVDSVLNSSENRIGLVGYSGSAPDSDYHELSSNEASLKNIINTQWSASGSTCICCGINRASQDLASNSSENSFASMVVMSDGEANVQCPEQNTGNSKQDAIQAACDAFTNNNLTVYAIGFGDDADETTLQAIAACGNGEYYFSNVDQLSQIYQQIAAAIIASYTEQTIAVTGDILTTLFADSYIEFTYNQSTFPFGLIVTLESPFTTDQTGTFSTPLNSSILETRVVSYSGPRWTDRVLLDNSSVYRISNYGSDYITLGDPFIVTLPNSLIDPGNTHTVNLTTGLSPNELLGGSTSNKILYTFVRNVSSFSPILASAQGCHWNLQFEDNSMLTSAIPASYSGSETCYFNESLGGQLSNPNDALQAAVLDLLEILDANLNDKIDVTFTEQDLQIATNQITGIPFTWSTEVQVRTWR